MRVNASEFTESPSNGRRTLGDRFFEFVIFVLFVCAELASKACSKL